jgi:ABC-type transport system involved in multi-copper enzyme maturation permease subunit
MQVWALIADSFRDALDRKVFWVMLLICVIIAAAMLCIGFDEKGVSLLFGLFRADYQGPLLRGYLGSFGIPRAAIGAFAVYLLMDFVLGSVAILLALIATAGVFPTLMERGAIDVVLAKPLPRWKLFLGKYLGSTVFVLIQASFFIVMTFFIIGLRWKTWLPGYLLSIPLLVVLYTYVYSVCVLIGVVTRSTITAILLSLAAWFAFSIIQAAPALFEMFVPSGKAHRWYAVAETVAWLVPRTQDIPYIAARWCEAGTSLDLSPAARRKAQESNDAFRIERAQQIEEEQLRISAAKSIGSSLGIELVIVLLAMRRFSKTDF